MVTSSADPMREHIREILEENLQKQFVSCCLCYWWQLGHDLLLYSTQGETIFYRIQGAQFDFTIDLTIDTQIAFLSYINSNAAGSPNYRLVYN